MADWGRKGRYCCLYSDIKEGQQNMARAFSISLLEEDFIDGVNGVYTAFVEAKEALKNKRTSRFISIQTINKAT